MPISVHALLSCIIAFTYGLNSSARADDTAITPTTPIRLLDQPRDTFVCHLGKDTAIDPSATAEDIFQFNGTGHLHITGQTWGYIRTAAAYRDYHLVMEYRFTGPTSGVREKKARDSGLLLHCFGADGSRRKNWIPCIEVQIMEGATGDFIVLGPFDDQKNRLPLQLESTATYVHPKKVPFFDPKGETLILPEDEPGTNAMFWQNRSRNYKEVRDWHADTDADFSTASQKWNRIDVIARGDKIDVHVNGRSVNRGWNIQPAQGFVGIQSEGAEVEFRHWTLHPLDSVPLPAPALTTAP